MDQVGAADVDRAAERIRDAISTTPLERNQRLSKATAHHRLDAVRAHLLEMAGDTEAAVVQYRAAASRATSLPEQHYLATRAARLSPGTMDPFQS